MVEMDVRKSRESMPSGQHDEKSKEARVLLLVMLWMWIRGTILDKKYYFELVKSMPKRIKAVQNLKRDN